MKILKYEIVQSDVNTYKIITHYSFFGIKFSSYEKNYYGDDQYWKCLIQVTEWVLDNVKSKEYTLKYPKTYELE